MAFLKIDKCYYNVGYLKTIKRIQLENGMISSTLCIYIHPTPKIIYFFLSFLSLKENFRNKNFIIILTNTVTLIAVESIYIFFFLPDVDLPHFKIIPLWLVRGIGSKLVPMCRQEISVKVVRTFLEILLLDYFGRL